MIVRPFMYGRPYVIVRSAPSIVASTASCGLARLPNCGSGRCLPSTATIATATSPTRKTPAITRVFIRKAHPSFTLYCRPTEGLRQGYGGACRSLGKAEAETTPTLTYYYQKCLSPGARRRRRRVGATAACQVPGNARLCCRHGRHDRPV